ncbi:MAG: sulfatase-like hydrolase/transferase [Pseudomonadales bacterium]
MSAFQTVAKRRLTTALFFVLLQPAQILFAKSIDDADALPNVVIILTDDMGYGDIGVNSQTPIKTPHIDHLANNGLNFTQFYASANVCTPSRAGLMTGRYAIRMGLAKGVLSAESNGGMPNNEETIAELAKRAGLSTSLIGKWHLGSFPDHHPLNHGWEEFFGTPHSNDMPDFALFRGLKKIEQPVKQSLLTERYTEEAIGFIARNSRQPFLLMVSHNMPHIPLYASKAFQGRSAAGTYGDVIEELDASVGRIIDELSAQGILENTLVLFTSDNGPFFEGSVGGLKGGKGNGWDGGYRVPAVISWPAKLKQSRSVETISSNLDILPTLAEVLRVKPRANDLDGRSLLSVMHGANKSAHDFLYYFNNEEIIGVRNQHWKLLTHVYYRRSLGAFEKFDQLDGFNGSYDMLFDMSSTHGEQYSVADRQPAARKRLKSQLDLSRQRFQPMMLQAPDVTFPK